MSFVLQGVLLVVIAANIEVGSGEKSAGEQQSMEQSIQIEQVTLPPQTPPEAPPEEVPPDFQQPAPMEEIPEPDAIAMATPAPAEPTPPPPTQTPTPAVSATPSPESSPSPAASASPDMMAQSKPQPSTSLAPSPTPGPTPTPDPSEALPPQFANLPEPQKEAARSLKKYLEKQGLELPEDLPPGFRDWEHYNEFINDDYNSKAKDMAKLPDPTKGSDGGSAPDNTNTTDDPSGSPDTSGTNSAGDGAGDGTGGGGGGSWFSLPGNKKNPRFDSNLNADDIKSRNLDGNFEEDGKLFGNKSLDDLSKTRDLKFDPNAPLALPTPTPIPLPSLKSGDIGVFMYINFAYDGKTFRAQWPSESIKDKKVTVQYFPAAEPTQIKGFDVPWVAEFAEDHKNVAQAILQTYERRKRSS